MSLTALRARVEKLKHLLISLKKGKFVRFNNVKIVLLDPIKK